MYRVERKSLKLAGRVIEPGQFVYDEDFDDLKDIIRQRRINALLSLGRIVPVTSHELDDKPIVEPIKRRGRPKREQ